MPTLKRLVASALAAALSTVAIAAHADGKSEDARIRAEVQKQIDKHSELKFDNIQVRTVDKVVYLDGRATSGADKHAAEEIARQVSGVARVENKISVVNRGN